jgi:hypothetical protein
MRCSDRKRHEFRRISGLGKDKITGDTSGGSLSGHALGARHALRAGAAAGKLFGHFALGSGTAWIR